MVLMSARIVGAQPSPAFPPSVTTDQERIDWLAAEVDVLVEAVDAEAEKPLTQQREAVFGGVLARGVDLGRLADAIPGRSSRLRARLNEAMTRARAGLERIANGRLRIGMTAEQVREIRGEPARRSLAATATGVRQRWHYEMTVLSFEDGNLAEIVLMLTGE
jgi:hypothetical protein